MNISNNVMTHKEYLSAINHEQSLMRRLFTSRRKRSQKIDEITKTRYSHLIGKFFTRERDTDTIWRINDVYANSNYVASDKVDVIIDCVCIDQTRRGDDMALVGLGMYHRDFIIDPSVDADEYIGNKFVSDEDAENNFNNLVNEFRKNYFNY